MSKDPFQELFDREIPRSAPPAATRTTLDALTPRFRRARSRRRARIGAVAAVAVFGTTAGAAAIGIVGPIGADNDVPTDFTGFASATAVDNLPEPAPLDATDETIVVEPTEPTEVPSHIDIDDSPRPNIDPPEPTGVASDPSANDDGSPAAEVPGASVSPDDNSNSGSDHDETDNDETDNDETSAPIPGPLTRTIDEGTVKVDSEGDHLVVVEVLPAQGVDYTVSRDDEKPVEVKVHEVKVHFFDAASGEGLSTLEFKLVEGGITYKVESPAS